MPTTTNIKPIEKALKKIENRFLLTVATARRWEQIVQGSPPLATAPSRHMFDIVLNEIIDDKLEVDDEELTIRPVGQPELEQNDEPLFSEAFDPEARNVRDLLGGD
jgi:DNA-directed RNA polymerase subunit K/omega